MYILTMYIDVNATSGNAINIFDVRRLKVMQAAPEKHKINCFGPIAIHKPVVRLGHWAQAQSLVRYMLEVVHIPLVPVHILD